GLLLLRVALVLGHFFELLLGGVALLGVAVLHLLGGLRDVVLAALTVVLLIGLFAGALAVLRVAGLRRALPRVLVGHRLAARGVVRVHRLVAIGAGLIVAVGLAAIGLLGIGLRGRGRVAVGLLRAAGLVGVACLRLVGVAIRFLLVVRFRRTGLGLVVL